MKLKHAVVLSNEELDALFTISMNACLGVYPTPEEQAKAIGAAKIEFETLLNRYVQKSFKLGKKVGKMKYESKKDSTETPVPSI